MYYDFLNNTTFLKVFQVYDLFLKQIGGSILNFFPCNLHIITRSKSGAYGKTKNVDSMQFRWNNVNFSSLIDAFQQFFIVLLALVLLKTHYYLENQKSRCLLHTKPSITGAEISNRES